MPGFWTKTPEGHAVHVNGDPHLSEETRFILSLMIDQAAKQFPACLHPDSDCIHSTPWGPYYIFAVHRCRQCGETTVKVLGNQGVGVIYLATLPTQIKHYATNKPSAGWAYYWRFDGLTHSTPPIAPAPESEGA